MTRASATLMLVIPLLSLLLALGLAGWQAEPLARQSHAGTATVADPRPRPVSVVNGFIARQGLSGPGLDVRNCPALPQIYDLLPVQDAIAPLEYPLFVSSQEVPWLSDRDLVLGLTIGKESHCYPLAILNWHCLVHDRLAGQTVYVFLDPPSGVTLARRQWSASRPLGLAGLGYRGVGLAYEKKSGALWDLLMGRPLSYPGKPLGFVSKLGPDYGWLPLQRSTWAAWKRKHPNTLVLSRETGFALDYSRDPYASAALGPAGAPENYWTSDLILAPANLRDTSGALPDKAWVQGFLWRGEAWACPVADWLAGGRKLAILPISGGPLKLHVTPEDETIWVTDPKGKWAPQVRMFWFAWKARFPQTQIWSRPLDAQAAPLTAGQPGSAGPLNASP